MAASAESFIRQSLNFVVDIGCDWAICKLISQFSVPSTSFCLFMPLYLCLIGTLGEFQNFPHGGFPHFLMPWHSFFLVIHINGIFESLF